MHIISEDIDLMSTLNGTASNTSWNVFIQSMVAIPLYVLFILLPSLFLNGSIVLAFFKKKYVRTQLNLFTVNQCCVGIFSNLLNGSLQLIATPVVLKHGSCAITPLVIASVSWTHYGITCSTSQPSLFVCLSHWNMVLHALRTRKLYQ